MAKEFHFIHHAAFTLMSEGKKAIFDPFLEGNPEGLTAEMIDADWIFVSHGHHDHLGDAVAIAKLTGATTISTAEICGLVSQSGCKCHAMHLGGTHEFEFGKVRLTPAFHGAGVPGGHACGFIVNFYGIRLYFAGDTALFGDMGLLPKLEPIDVAVLPIGDNYTMGPKDAVLAAELLKAPVVIPVHYNTWPIIRQDPVAYKNEVEEKNQSRVLIVRPGETINLDRL